MNLAAQISTWYYNGKVRDIVAEISDIGFQGVELTSHCDLWLDCSFDELVQHIRSRNLHIPALYTTCPLCSQMYHNAAGEPLRKTMEKAVLYKIPRVIIGNPPLEKFSCTAEAARLVLKNLGFIASTFNGPDIPHICFQFHYGSLFHHPEIIEEVASQSLLPFCLDTAHLILSSVDPSNFLDQYRSQIPYIQIKDVRRAQRTIRERLALLSEFLQLKDLAAYKESFRPAFSRILRARKNDFVELGQGELNLNRFVNTLLKEELPEWITLELDAPELLAGRSMDRCRKTFLAALDTCRQQLVPSPDSPNSQ